MNDFKSVRLYKNANDYEDFTQEELLNRKLTFWRGWKCAAGTYKIHIDADGNVFSGACKVGGKLGNIYHGEEIKFPNGLITCTKNVCACGDDMMIPKSKFEKLVDLAYGKTISYNPGNDEFIAAGPVDIKFLNDCKKYVSWDFLRRCNYYCSYCPANASNTFEEFRNFEEIQKALQKIICGFGRNEKIKFVISGGEPCLHPNFMDLVKDIVGHGHVLHVTTNGSRSSEYFSELIKYADIGVSVHLEFVKYPHLKDILKSMLKTKRMKIGLAKYNWIGVKIMVPPYSSTIAKEMIDWLVKDFGRDIGKNIYITVSSVFRPSNSNELMLYPRNEMNWINKFGKDI